MIMHKYGMCSDGHNCRSTDIAKLKTVKRLFFRTNYFDTHALYSEEDATFPILILISSML